MVRAKKQSKPKEKVVQEAGKRKRAVARATIKKGSGLIKINSRDISTVEPEVVRQRIMEPILIAEELAKNLNIWVNVYGGGWSGQAEAARLAIAKALVTFTGSQELKKKYLDYDRHLLVADTRYKETRKPGRHSKARAKRQLSFR